MIKTVWKPDKEIEFMLQDKKKVGIISCGICANLSGTGGEDGIKTLSKTLSKIDKEVSFSAISVACCQEDLMSKVMKVNKSKIQKSDALAILSCASGVKIAMLENPEIPIFPILDTMGAIPVTHNTDPVAQSICVGCGPCVIGYTAGICPVSKCPLHLKYGSCGKSLDNGDCFTKPGTKCIWELIIKRGGDEEKLKKLKIIHEKDSLEKPIDDLRLDKMMIEYRRKKSITFFRDFIALLASHFRPIAKFLTLFR